MKTLRAFLFIAAFAFVFLGCQKNLNKQTTSEASTLTGKALPGDCTSTWQGIYTNSNMPKKTFTVPDSLFIGGGIAQLLHAHSPYGHYYTSMVLPIPDCVTIPGDSAKIVVSLKNPDNIPYAAFGYSVSIWMYGTTDSAHVQFQAGDVEYTELKVGNHGVTGDSALLHLFEDFTEVQMATVNNVLSIRFQQGKPLVKTHYSSSIGNLKRIAITFRSSGSVDYVRIYNTRTNKQVMQETFNKGHQSDVVFK